MATPFTSLKIVPNFSVQGTTLTWTLDPTFQDESPFNFTVELSESPVFEKVIWSKDVGNTHFGVNDSNLQQGPLLNTFYYRIKLTTRHKTYYSNVLNYLAGIEDLHKFLNAQEIARKEMLRISMYTGYKGYLLKRKNYIEIDPTVTSSISGMVLVEGGTAYGSIQQAYYKPLAIMYSEEDRKAITEFSQIGTIEQEDINVRFIGFPLITVKDVLVNDKGARYLISRVQPTYYPGTRIIILQQAIASLLPLTDPIYNIVIS